MPNAQFVVYNDAGIEQVSFNGINLALVHKEVISSPALWTPTIGPSQTGLSYQFTVTAKSPMLAISTSVTGQGGAVVADLTMLNSATWKVTLFGAASRIAAGPTPGSSTLTAAVTVYVFDQAPAPTSGPGLALYDASGTCFFNALYPGARVKTAIGSIFNLNGYPTSVPIPSGKVYATLQRSAWGELLVATVNSTTGDRTANIYRYGSSGGSSGASASFGNGFSCFVPGAVSLPHGSSGAIGSQYSRFGCTDGGSPAQFYSDGLILDVTNL